MISKQIIKELDPYKRDNKTFAATASGSVILSVALFASVLFLLVAEGRISLPFIPHFNKPAAISMVVLPSPFIVLFSTVALITLNPLTPREKKRALELAQRSRIELEKTIGTLSSAREKRIYRLAMNLQLYTMIQSRNEVAYPFVWEATRGDQKVTVVGSCHSAIFREDDTWEQRNTVHPYLKQAIDKAEAVYFEIVIQTDFSDTSTLKTHRLRKKDDEILHKYRSRWCTGGIDRSLCYYASGKKPIEGIETELVRYNAPRIRIDDPLHPTHGVSHMAKYHWYMQPEKII